jgi:dTDP-4-dehydrorhamnose 3,5-epimerase-like enzyme
VNPDSAPISGQEPSILVLSDISDDERGSSFSVARDYMDFVGQPEDIHVASILPGHTRGNHYHVERREVIIVIYSDRWSLSWDSGAETERSNRAFEGEGVVVTAIPPNSAHAITNTGATPLWLVAMTDGAYDPARPDAFRRIVTAH